MTAKKAQSKRKNGKSIQAIATKKKQSPKQTRQGTTRKQRHANGTTAVTANGKKQTQTKNVKPGKRVDEKKGPLKKRLTRTSSGSVVKKTQKRNQGKSQTIPAVSTEAEDVSVHELLGRSDDHNDDVDMDVTEFAAATVAARVEAETGALATPLFFPSYHDEDDRYAPSYGLSGVISPQTPSLNDVNLGNHNDDGVDHSGNDKSISISDGLSSEGFMMVPSHENVIKLLNDIQSSLTTTIAIPALHVLLAWSNGTKVATKKANQNILNETLSPGALSTSTLESTKSDTVDSSSIDVTAFMGLCSTYGAIGYLLDCIEDRSSSLFSLASLSRTAERAKEMKASRTVIELGSKILTNMMSLTSKQQITTGQSTKNEGKQQQQQELAKLSLVDQFISRDGIGTLLKVISMDVKYFTTIESKTGAHAKRKKAKTNENVQWRRRIEKTMVNLWGVMLCTVRGSPVVLLRQRNDDRAQLYESILSCLTIGRKFGLQNLLLTLMEILNTMALYDQRSSSEKGQFKNDDEVEYELGLAQTWSEDVAYLTTSILTSSNTFEEKDGNNVETHFICTDTIYGVFNALFPGELNYKEESDDQVLIVPEAARILDNPILLTQIVIFFTRVEVVDDASIELKEYLIAVCLDFVQAYPENNAILGASAHFLEKTCPKIKVENKEFLDHEGVAIVLNRIKATATGANKGLNLNGDILDTLERTIRMLDE